LEWAGRRKALWVLEEETYLEDRILIVDDEEIICLILAQRLFKEGYICATANDGKKALNHFYKNHFSLMITDIKMPEMDGMELLKNVKTINSNMMVIIMTSYPEIGVAVEAMRLGANDFLIKPIDLDLLVLSVRNALEKKRLREEVETYRNHLEKLVEERTAQLQHTLLVLKKAHLDSVKILAEIIDAKDPYTRGHSDRVRKMSMRIGMRMGFDQKRLENIVFGALLHDIGKMGIRDEVLQKKDHLTPEEYQYIQKHTVIGAKIVEGIDFFKDKIPMIRNHHEHFDGNGYPDGLIGEVIPLEARIIAVPDAFDAMTSARPHRSTMALKVALEELERGKGKQFDPQILEIFLNEKIYQ
jgi:putative nucleotidyltransferase with HDIG domain